MIDEYECHENKVITELKEDNARGARYIEHLKSRIFELVAERDGLSRHIAAGAAWDSPDSLSLQNAQLKARVAELEQQVQLDDKAKRVMVQWSSGEKRELKARIEELEKIVSSCLRELPVGYVQAHTPESIPDRIAYYVQQVTELEAKCASSDALITKMFYAGNTMRDWSQDRGPNWDKCCEIWDKVVEELL
jgi:chromosome condensin MukBEF ATPase and DNA-binding subunit MukB